MSYLVEDLAHTTSSFVKITDGKYLDIVVGKYVKTEDLTVKIDNFLTVIYSQVISAMRQATSTLATSLQVEALQSDATGIPFASYNSIHEAAETILKSLCLIDANIDTYKKEPLDVVTNYISVCLGNMQTKEE